MRLEGRPAQTRDLAREMGLTTQRARRPSAVELQLDRPLHGGEARGYLYGSALKSGIEALPPTHVEGSRLTASLPALSATRHDLSRGPR